TMELQILDNTQPSGPTPTSLGFTAGTAASAGQLTAAPTGALTANSYFQPVLAATPFTSVDYTAANEFLLSLASLPPITVSLRADAPRTTADSFAAAIHTALAAKAVDPTLLGLASGSDIPYSSLITASGSSVTIEGSATTGEVIKLTPSLNSAAQSDLSYTV